MTMPIAAAMPPDISAPIQASLRARACWRAPMLVPTSVVKVAPMPKLIGTSMYSSRLPMP